MTAYPKMTAEERKAEYAEVTREYEELKARGLNLNMARGKPGKAQLDLVSDIFSLMQKPEDYVSDGVDVRNYGELSGLPAAKRLFAEILGCRPEQVVVGGKALASCEIVLSEYVESKRLALDVRRVVSRWML